MSHELHISRALTYNANNKTISLYSLLFCHKLLTIPNDGRRDLTNPEKVVIPLCYAPFHS
jgi:hypothetical protein